MADSKFNTNFSLDTHNVDSMTGAVYFVVGRGTEGGPDSYRLSVAGVAAKHWGKVESVAANSGYSIGTIQVDFGQRGAWALGAVTDTHPKPGQTTYVDAVVDQAAKYAEEHGLKFAQDKEQLRRDLLSHGDHQHLVGEGKHRHADSQTPLRFIDQDTRDSINAWSSSSEGQQWIHKNIDLPQVKNATQAAMDLLDKYGKNFPEDRRLETIAILAKTTNQRPGELEKTFKPILEKGGDYNAVLEAANQIRHHVPYYAGAKAATLAEDYKNAAKNPETAAALGRAQAKVNGADFDPSKSANDPDINTALKAVHQGGRSKDHGPDVVALQTKLGQLGYANPDRTPLATDGHMGRSTREALKAFQREHHLKDDGMPGPNTLKSIEAMLKERATPSREQHSSSEHKAVPQITDRNHPAHPLLEQAKGKLTEIDIRLGRKPDQMTENAAAAIAAAAAHKGLTRIDHLELNDKGDKFIAAQGQPGTAQSKVIDVPTATAVNTTVAQSSQAFSDAQQTQRAQQPTQSALQQAEPALSR